MRSNIFIAIIIVFVGVLVAQYYNTRDEQSSGTLYLTAPIAFENNYTSNWKALERTILTTTTKTIVIYWEGNGGYVYQGHQFIDVVEKAKSEGKTITFVVTGSTWSMHANVLCYNNSVMQSNAYLVFHNVRTTIFGTTTYNDSLTREELSACGKYLSKQDINIIVGQKKALVIKADGTRIFIND